MELTDDLMKLRASMYKILSWLFADHVEQKNIMQLLEQTELCQERLGRVLAEQRELKAPLDDLCVALKALAGSLRALAEGEPNDVASKLLAPQREYVSLFLLPTGVHPYESVYRDTKPLLKGQPWKEVREFYLSCGLALDEGEVHPEDHVAVELGFMALGAMAADDQDVMHSQREFLLGHLAEWIPLLAERIRAHEAAEFYVVCADLLVQWIALDESMLG